MSITPFDCFFLLILYSLLFFFNDTAPTEIYTLSLHDALPIYVKFMRAISAAVSCLSSKVENSVKSRRSEEHTSELQSHSDLVCRLLLEKKKNKKTACRHMDSRITTRKEPGRRTRSSPSPRHSP